MNGVDFINMCTVSSTFGFVAMACRQRTKRQRGGRACHPAGVFSSGAPEPVACRQPDKTTAGVQGLASSCRFFVRGPQARGSWLVGSHGCPRDLRCRLHWVRQRQNVSPLTVHIEEKRQRKFYHKGWLILKRAALPPKNGFREMAILYTLGVTQPS